MFAWTMRLTKQAQLARLFRAEDAMRRRCALVASRLELAASALVLLEVACHADAALDDLDGLASARGVALENIGARVLTWVGALVNWASGLWPASAAWGYRILLAEMHRDLALAASLRRESVEAGDARLADWCALWTEQRWAFAKRLEATLADSPLT